MHLLHLLLKEKLLLLKLLLFFSYIRFYDYLKRKIHTFHMYFNTHRYFYTDINILQIVLKSKFDFYLNRNIQQNYLIVLHTLL